MENNVQEFWNAIVKKDFEKIKELVSMGVDVNVRNNAGTTALMYAASEGNIEFIKILIECNADVNIKSLKGKTAKQIAEVKGHSSVVQYLNELNPMDIDIDIPDEGPSKLLLEPDISEGVELEPEMDSNEFFIIIGFKELIKRAILIPYGSNYQLKAQSVAPLIKLMQEKGVEKIYYQAKWYLMTNGEFSNRLGNIYETHISRLVNKGDVFMQTNRNIHPFYEGDGSIQDPPLPPPPLSEEIDVIEFLSSLDFNELLRKGILVPIGSNYQLKGTSVKPLIKLMQEKGIEKIYYQASWYLMTNGEFLNRLGGIRETHISQLRNPGDVFKGTNLIINPFYQGKIIREVPQIPDPPVPVNPIDSNEFFTEIGYRELLRKGILIQIGQTYQVKAQSVGPLIKLMQEKGYDQIFYQASWYLMTSGHFMNRLGNVREIHILQLINKGDVFSGTNRDIHPYYNGER